MKCFKFLYIIILSVLLYGNLHSQYTTKWEVVNSVSKDCHFYAGKKVLDYCDKEHVVALGSYTTSPLVSNQVLKYNISSNEIKTLYKDTIHIADRYESIAHPSEDVIVCVGSTYDTVATINYKIYERYYGIITLSVDSGKTWKRMLLDSNTAFVDISMINKNTGIILQNNRINYYNESKKPFDTLLYTNDCWNTYTKIPLNFSSPSQYCTLIKCISENKFILLCYDYSKEQMFILKSDDRGLNWQKSYVFDRKYYTTSSFEVYNENNICLFLRREYDGTYHRIPYLYRTLDGGGTWDIPWNTECKNISGPSLYSSIDYYDSLNIIISFHETLFRTSDGGNTWIREHIPNEYERNGNIKQVVYPDTHISLLVTDIGNILVNKNKKILAKPEIIIRNSWSNEYLNNLETKWKSIEGATKYRVIYNGTKKDSSWNTKYNYMINPICDTLVSDTSIIIPKLRENYQYQIWVKAIGNGIESEWSTPHPFLTNSIKYDLLQPILISPVQDSWVKDSLVTLVWNKVPDAESYDIYITSYLANYNVEKLDVIDTVLNDLYFPPHYQYNIKIRSRTRDYSKKSSFSTINFYRWYSLNETYIEDLKFKKNNVHIYPNPAKDYIEIQNEDTSRRPVSIGIIEIYNVLGECVKSISIHPLIASHRMNIEDLPAGVYFVVINDGNGILEAIFVKE